MMETEQANARSTGSSTEEAAPKDETFLVVDVPAALSLLDYAATCDDPLICQRNIESAATTYFMLQLLVVICAPTVEQTKQLAGSLQTLRERLIAVGVLL
jgi:hypothetical protein